MSYIDPREMTKNPENGFMLEGDNRVEEMYNWSGKILDLCDLPVEEYMKPMQVIVLGSGELPETGATQYTLKFIVDGVTVAQEKIASGEPIPFSVNAEKEGRNFIGWYYGNTKYEEGALMPSKSLTLTAKYECDVKFIFIIDGVEEEVSAYTVAYDSKLINIPSTSKEGYEFKGWEPSIKNAIVEHTTFKGTFEAIIYNVIWNGYTDGPIQQEYKYNEALIQPVNPEKVGYTFKGWDKEIPAKVVSDIEFNAVFEVNKYQVSYFEIFNGNKTLLSAFTMDYGATISKPVIPFENGYTYTKWEGEYAGATVPAFDIEFITVKTINSYTLSYFVNGIGNNEAVKIVAYEYKAPIDTYVFEKEGYYPVTEWEGLPTHMPYNDLKVYGKTEIMKFTVKFIDEEGILIKEETGVTYGTTIESIIPSNTVEYEYTFNESDLAIVVKEDLIINVVKVKKQYEVTFVINGVEEKVSLEYGVNLTEYVTENYIPSEGYYLNIVSMSHNVVPGNNSAKVEITYEANPWILSWSTNGAGEQDINGKKTVTFGSNIMENLPETELEGFVFNGWFNGENKVSEADTMPNKDVAVNGTYNVIMLHVNVKDGETVVLSKDYAYGTKFEVVLNEENVQNYISSSFESGYVVTINIEPELTIVKDMEVEVSKTEREFVLTFMNGENIISSAMVKYNATIVYPEMSDYIENGVEYVFVWEDDSRNGQPMPMEDVIIVGNYVEKPAAPIYYGVFVTSATSPDSKIYNDSDLGMYFKTVNVSECFEEKEVDIFMDADKTAIEFIENDDWDGFDEYCASHLYPSCFLIPVEVIEKYDFVAVLKADGAQKNFTSDNKPLNINGSNYYLYTYLNPDSMMAGDGPQTFTYKITLK